MQSTANRMVVFHPILVRAFLRPPIRFVIILYRCSGGLPLCSNLPRSMESVATLDFDGHVAET
jgi:hypothetical protein